MLIEIKWLTCDICGATFGEDMSQLDTAPLLRERAKEIGWMRVDKRDLCAYCDPTRSKEG